MRGRSHQKLGNYLLENYMPCISALHRKAFLMGCIEPDRNPVTYLKGSLRHQWLRGHNFHNASAFMNRIASRLERKQKLHFFDYYTLGKLIHYTTDAFTYAHNDMFSAGLEDHLAYEAALQDHFLVFLDYAPRPVPSDLHSIMDSIHSFHREYRTLPADIYTDSYFALRACCSVLEILFSNHPHWAAVPGQT